MTDYLQLLKAVRHPGRVRSSDLLPRIVDNFTPFDSPDLALLAGTATLNGQVVVVFAQQKPKDRSFAGAAAVNFGMMCAAGYWFVLERLDAAASRGLPVLTLIDTPGADPSKEGVEQRLAWAISAAISGFMSYPGPSVSMVIGEGGSGGALALQIADQRLIACDAMYSVISPESCSAILFREATRVEDALRILRPTADDALRVGLVDRIVEWGSCATTDHDGAAREMRAAIVDAFEQVSEMQVHERRRRRRQKILACGSRRGERFPPEDPTRPKSDERSPFFAPDSVSLEKCPPPTMRKLVAVGAENDLMALLQHAYFSAAAEKGDDGPKVLCPRNRGGCGGVSTMAGYESAGWACPSCGMGERLSANQWASLLCDRSSFLELHANLDLTDLEDAGYDNDSYRRQRARARETSGAQEAMRIGIAHIEGHRVALALSEFGFLGGTLGAVCGEKVRLICETARSERIPLVAVTCSGGARMQEGLLALAQMAKTNATVIRLLDSGLPYISILADPCTGGSLGSYATFATAVLAEPQALIAFAGPRVTRLAGLQLDERLLTSNRAALHGGIDEVVDRRRLRARIVRYLELAVTERKAKRTGQDVRRSALLERELDHWLNAFITRASGLFEGEDGLAAVQTIVALSRSEEPHERAAALLAIQRLRLLPLREITCQLANDADSQVCIAAAVALFALGEEVAGATRLRALIQDLGGFAISAAEKLQSFLQDDARKQLLDVLKIPPPLSIKEPRF